MYTLRAILVVGLPVIIWFFAGGYFFWLLARLLGRVTGLSFWRASALNLALVILNGVILFVILFGLYVLLPIPSRPPMAVPPPRPTEPPLGAAWSTKAVAPVTNPPGQVPIEGPQPPNAGIRVQRELSTSESRARIVGITRFPGPTPGTSVTEYVVATGDTPRGFSEKLERVLDNTRRWTEIINANPGVDFNKTQLGQIIRVPISQPSNPR
jgi:hypothetical protein